MSTNATTPEGAHNIIKLLLLVEMNSKKGYVLGRKQIAQVLGMNLSRVNRLFKTANKGFGVQFHFEVLGRPDRPGRSGYYIIKDWGAFSLSRIKLNHYTLAREVMTAYNEYIESQKKNHEDEAA